MNSWISNGYFKNHNGNDKLFTTEEIESNQYMHPDLGHAVKIVLLCKLTASNAFVKIRRTNENKKYPYSPKEARRVILK